MWAYALRLISPESSTVRVFDDFQFMLLVWVEESVEGGAREEESLGDQGGEVS